MIRIFILTLSIVALGACEKSDGGFGDADKGQLGVHVKPAKQKGPPNFTGAMKLNPSYDKATNTVSVTVQLREGFHAYAPGSEIGQPVSLLVRADNGWQIDGSANIPQGKKKSLGTLGNDYVLEGSFPLTAKLKAGSGEIMGDVKVQVCTANACDRPRKYAFTVGDS